ncbi:NanA [Streptococcus oralis]|uniref:NanA n=1 Tax=Streptococcus oralis TaxID=1303 RepID=A0A139P3F3_STROR|nr:NanA [Streptococcus oralis]
MSDLSATSKQYFEQPATSFLACSLIFIEHQKEILQITDFLHRLFHFVV